ncbi:MULTISPECIES: ImmA/IrrE family metallo-endopeptidase [unclassified Pseudoxanthomonas]|uniref:ImmA/IrrE family metallo-endopeptidase n=1 Tax=unclassified Pseudoxanthomonas TaxID=2645906 RepID=UPI0030784C15
MKAGIDQKVVQLRKASTIEEQAHQLRWSVWNSRCDLFKGRIPDNPVDLLEPGIALCMLGFEVLTEIDLGEMFDCGRRVRVAGQIDTGRKIVRISSQLTHQETRFTAGHELAHAVLHPAMNGLHRDRALSGPQYRKEKVEVEADRFTSAYLMSPKLVFGEFAKRFGTDVFRLNEESIFGLSLRAGLHKLRNTRDVSYVVAQASMYMGLPFDSLANKFRVSPTAMAIRLEELGLIEDFSSQRMW